MNGMRFYRIANSGIFIRRKLLRWKKNPFLKSPVISPDPAGEILSLKYPKEALEALWREKAG
jgi:hypothetical protein